MDELIRNLKPGARVLDLGAGGGSFSYQSTRAQVIALDLDFSGASQTCTGRVLGDSRNLPFGPRIFDVVVCNHTLEHFEQPERAVVEIERVLKTGAHVWIAVPNGFGFDDALYRYIFEGGGHVNRFSLDSLVETVEDHTTLRARRYKKLYSGFVYLQPPKPERLQHYPDRAARLAEYPAHWLRRAARWLNWTVRFIDRWLGTRLSLYGYGVIFSSRGGCHSLHPCRKNLQEIPSDRNVCFNCGTGHPAASLQPLLKRRLLLWRIYACPVCGARNVYS